MIRKDKPIGNVLGAGFSWDGLADAAADVYLGVSQIFAASKLH